MAEICCGVFGKEAPAALEATSSRRRRLDNIVPYNLAVEADNSRKRQKHVHASATRVDVESGEENFDLNRTISVETNDDEKLRENTPKFGMTSVCGRRRDMEDAISVYTSLGNTNTSFFGVFDGHGCSHVAMKCRDRLHKIVEEEMKKYEDLKSVKWRETMERSYARMDKEIDESKFDVGDENCNCRCELQTPQCDAVGSTAVVTIVTPDKIVVANCGDSRAVLSRNGVAIPLSLDHKPDRPDELVRIEAAGGRVIYWDGPRVLGVLAMSRAIGDNYLKPYVIPDPEVMEMERTEGDECLILASDGLWDVVTNDTACKVVSMCLKALQSSSNGDITDSGIADGNGVDKACFDASILLTKLALARHTADNVSVVVVNLKRT